MIAAGSNTATPPVLTLPVATVVAVAAALPKWTKWMIPLIKVIFPMKIVSRMPRRYSSFDLLLASVRLSMVTPLSVPILVAAVVTSKRLAKNPGGIKPLSALLSKSRRVKIPWRIPIRPMVSKTPYIHID